MKGGEVCFVYVYAGGAFGNMQRGVSSSQDHPQAAEYKRQALDSRDSKCCLITYVPCSAHTIYVINGSEHIHTLGRSRPFVSG